MIDKKSLAYMRERTAAQPKPGNYDWMPGHLQGQDLWIVGGGPSIAAEKVDLSLIAQHKTMAVCHAARFVKRLDFLVFLDADVLRQLTPELLGAANWGTAHFRVLTRPRACLQVGGSVTVLNAERINGPVSLDPSKDVFSARSGGHFAITCGLIMGARRIFLLGFDCTYTSDHKAHFYDTVGVKGLPVKPIESYQGMLDGFREFKKWRGTIYNCSEMSEIPVDVIPKVSYSDALRMCAND